MPAEGRPLGLYTRVVAPLGAIVLITGGVLGIARADSLGGAVVGVVLIIYGGAVGYGTPLIRRRSRSDQRE